jgi:hypothetical protein
MESYIVDWLNLGVRWLFRDEQGGTPPCRSPIPDCARRALQR